jgi:hypothetical protein
MKPPSVIHRTKHDRKPVRDINAEPEMIELKRMIRDGELDAGRTIASVKGEWNHEDKAAD